MTIQDRKIQDQNKHDQLLEAAKQLLSAAGIDANAFDTAINAIQTAKDQSSSIVNPKNKNYLDKTLILKMLIPSFTNVVILKVFGIFGSGIPTKSNIQIIEHRQDYCYGSST